MADVQGPGPDQSSDNVFTRKIGPLPMWGWMAIALLLALFYYLYKKNSSSGGGASASTVNTPGGVDSSLVPQFVNQNYAAPEPPEAPQMTTPVPTKTQTVNAFSWTDTGQKWSLNELAKHLGISPKALKPSNEAAVDAVQSPNKKMEKGAHFTYVKEPKGITTTSTNDKAVKA